MTGPATPDEAFMRLAIVEAFANHGATAPNPSVGCVLVKEGAVVAACATAPGGRPHAEEQALASLAPGEALGCTAYVTLEPCGARSSGAPSCADLLVDAGAARVVYACEDPSPFASGQGSERLRAAGIMVETGLLAGEAAFLYAAWIKTLRSQ